MNGFSHLNVDIGFSPKLICAVGLCHLSAVIAIVMADIPMTLSLLCIVMVLCFFHLTLHELMLKQTAIVGIEGSIKDNHLILIDRVGNEYILSEIQHFSTTPFMILMKCLDQHSKQLWVYIPKDAVSVDAYRRLNVYLNFAFALQRQASKNS